MSRSPQDIIKEMKYMDDILLYVIRARERPGHSRNVPIEIIEYWKTVDDFIIRSNRVYRLLETEYKLSMEYERRNNIIKSQVDS